MLLSTSARSTRRVLSFFGSLLTAAWEASLAPFSPAYEYPASGRPWVHGGTLCYTRELRQRNPCSAVSQGEAYPVVDVERLFITALREA